LITINQPGALNYPSLLGAILSAPAFATDNFSILLRENLDESEDFSNKPEHF
jgi:hypothetical protein